MQELNSASQIAVVKFGIFVGMNFCRNEFRPTWCPGVEKFVRNEFYELRPCNSPASQAN